MRREWVAAERVEEVRAAAEGWKRAGAIDAGTFEEISRRYPEPRPLPAPLWRILTAFFVTAVLLLLTGALFIAFRPGIESASILLFFLAAACVVATEVAGERARARPSRGRRRDVVLGNRLLSRRHLPVPRGDAEGAREQPRDAAPPRRARLVGARRLALGQPCVRRPCRDLVLPPAGARSLGPPALDRRRRRADVRLRARPRSSVMGAVAPRVRRGPRRRRAPGRVRRGEPLRARPSARREPPGRRPRPPRAALSGANLGDGLERPSSPSPSCGGECAHAGRSCSTRESSSPRSP